MAITKGKKEELVRTYVDLLAHSQAVVFVRSRGLSVAEVTGLRSKVRDAGSNYHVIKNTLFRLALDEAKMPVPDMLSGPVSVTFCGEDIAPAVKAISDFAGTIGEREFQIIGGIVDNQVVGAEKAKSLATLPTKETLFVQILTGINAPAAKLAGVVTSSVRQILNVLQARVDQLQEGEAAA